ncbi:hypothetical protein BDV23DRAFT_159631 [Aspergillus alliaceus]|uniref:Uncharacterized protein n=1 Tax=Petromyces alliaceus TaxID=209559 RepID=A0A5N7C2J5_PETAA|nr:hypothetical protein BDV23DRAFT_159631 [Aspergillus alliaceus]
MRPKSTAMRSTSKSFSWRFCSSALVSLPSVYAHRRISIRSLYIYTFFFLLPLNVMFSLP